MRARSVSRAEGAEASRALQRVLYRCAKQDRRRRFHALFDKVARSDILSRAWQEVRANRGAPGVDGVSIEDVEESGIEAFLQDLAADLKAKTYRPSPLRQVRIPKRNGETRPLGIPTVRDRVAMTAAKIVLEPIFEADFLPSSFGFRPWRSAHDALEVVRVEANRGRNWVLDADLTDCFGSIDHDALMVQVAGRVSDRETLKLLRSWLRAGVLEGGELSASSSGTPQGSPISPLLANMALHVLDETWEQTSRRLGVLVRYADDFVILCASKDRADETRERVEQTIARLGLQLNPDKTRIACLAHGQEGFDFVGFHHHKVKSPRQRDRWYLRRWPSKRAMSSIKAKVHAATHRRRKFQPVDEVVHDLNRILRGWGNYFRPATGKWSKMWAIDCYVYERLERFMRIKHDGRGGWSRRDFYALYPHLRVHRLSLGTVRRRPVHARR